jgi:uncharacterized membrane protein YGL010W
MRTLEAHLSSYAEYHRDRRNIATHFVGIPMIVLGIEALLARPSIGLGGVPLSPALLVTLGGVGFYLALDRRFGLAMAALTSLALWFGVFLAAQPLAVWLAGALGLFLVGWVIQFVGHAYEGRKPAFVDDLVGLLVGPLFIVAETAFALGLRAELRDEIERRAGPTCSRSAGRVAASEASR